MGQSLSSCMGSKAAVAPARAPDPPTKQAHFDVAPVKVAKPPKPKAKAKKSDVPLDAIPTEAPVVPLVQRAVHPLFLAAVSQMEVEMEGRGRVKLADLYTHEVVAHFIKPHTFATRMSFVETLALMVMEEEEERQAATATAAADATLNPSASGRKDSVMSGTGTSGRGYRLSEDYGEMQEVLQKYRGWAGGAKPFQGPATYFLSHAWSYKLGDLRDLAKHHYEAVTGSEYKYSPVYYWIDIFAVSQNFTGDFQKHPDGNFPSVIKESEGVVFTMFPWHQPIAPRRIWCLFEAVTAVEVGVNLELLVDHEFRNSKLSFEQLLQSFKDIVSALDIGAAQATVDTDRQMILGMVRKREGGIDRFNKHMQELLQSRMLEMLLMRAVASQDSKQANILLAQGATFFQRHLKFKMARVTDVSAEIIAGALKTNTSITTLDLSPPNDKGLLTYKGVNALSRALLDNTTLLDLDLSCHRAVGDEGVHALASALAKGKNTTLQTLKLTKAGVDDTAAQELATLLQVNSSLTSLDLASNDEIKIEGLCAIFDGMVLNSTLQSLDLTAIKMADRSIWQGLCAMLKANTGLEVLVLAHCGLTARSLAIIAPGLEENARLQVLDLSSNHGIGGKGVASLGPHLGKNNSLIELMLSSCDVDGEGGAALRDALRTNGSLLHLGLAGNPLAKKEWEDMMTHVSSVITCVSIDSAPRGTAATSPPVVLWVPPGLANVELPVAKSPALGGGAERAGSSAIGAEFRMQLYNARTGAQFQATGGLGSGLAAEMFASMNRPGSSAFASLGAGMKSGASLRGTVGRASMGATLAGLSMAGGSQDSHGGNGFLQASITAPPTATARLRAKAASASAPGYDDPSTPIKQTTSAGGFPASKGSRGKSGLGPVAASPSGTIPASPGPLDVKARVVECPTVSGNKMEGELKRKAQSAKQLELPTGGSGADKVVGDKGADAPPGKKVATAASKSSGVLKMVAA